MNKSGLIKAMSEEADLSMKDSARLLDAFIKVTIDALSKEDTVSLVGFGVFSIKDRCPRTARNFKTHERIEIPASKAVKFKSGKALKDAVNAISSE